MFGLGGDDIRPERKLEDYPSFQPVRSRGHLRGAALLITCVLLLASVCTGASLALAGGAAAGGLRFGEQPRQPVKLETGCDGAWGNEPLDCLLQTA